MDLVEELAEELTRAANLVCDKVREHLDPAFRMSEGALLAMSGPDVFLHYHFIRAEYGGPGAEDRTAYPGLDEFAAGLKASGDEADVQGGA